MRSCCLPGAGLDAYFHLAGRRSWLHTASPELGHLGPQALLLSPSASLGCLYDPLIQTFYVLTPESPASQELFAVIKQEPLGKHVQNSLSVPSSTNTLPPGKQKASASELEVCLLQTADPSKLGSSEVEEGFLSSFCNTCIPPGLIWPEHPLRLLSSLPKRESGTHRVPRYPSSSAPPAAALAGSGSPSPAACCLLSHCL